MSELKKGVTSWVRDPGEPVVEAYYTVVQKYTMGKEAKAVSRIINGFDESGLAKSGLNIVSAFGYQKALKSIDFTDIFGYLWYTGNAKKNVVLLDNISYIKDYIDSGNNKK